MAFYHASTLFRFAMPTPPRSSSCSTTPFMMVSLTIASHSVETYQTWIGPRARCLPLAVTRPYHMLLPDGRQTNEGHQRSEIAIKGRLTYHIASITMPTDTVTISASKTDSETKRSSLAALVYTNRITLCTRPQTSLKRSFPKLAIKLLDRLRIQITLLIYPEPFFFQRSFQLVNENRRRYVTFEVSSLMRANEKNCAMRNSEGFKRLII